MQHSRNTAHRRWPEYQNRIHAAAVNASTSNPYINPMSNDGFIQDTAASQEKEQAAETKVEDTAKETAQEEIPTWIDKILKSFKNFDELYINKNGGVFTKGSPKNLVASATLYKNPYYKK